MSISWLAGTRSPSTARPALPATSTCWWGLTGITSAALDAVRDFGFPSADLQPEYLIEHRKILQIGHVPVQVHIITNISGVSWEEAWQSREASSYGDTRVFFIGRGALIAK